MQRSILDRLAVDTRSSKEYRSIYMSVEYRPMYRSILLSVDILGGSPSLHRYFTDTSLILHRCFTDTLPSPNVLVDIGRYIGSYIGRHSTKTRAVDKCSSIGRCICRYIGRYVGRQYLISVDIFIDSICYRSTYRWIASSISQYICRYIGRQCLVSVDSIGRYICSYNPSNIFALARLV